jgi:hypothetical protein
MIDHDTDLFGWTQEQYELLRNRRFGELDLTNLLDELNYMGNSFPRELGSRLTLIYMHLLKWVYQPRHRSRSWRLTIKTQGREVEKLLRKNPSLKAKLDELALEAYTDAIADAADETDLPKETFPTNRPADWTPKNILSEEWVTKFLSS